jgi:hypothetical protein
MIEKKVGNVTLKMSEQGAPVNVVLGNLVIRIIHPMGFIPDFGPEITAAIEDLRKPLAENECWGPEGERLRFELRDKDGMGMARIIGGIVDAAIMSEDNGFACPGHSSQVAALRIWAEKERGRWGTERNCGAGVVYVTRDGKLEGYGWVSAKGWNDNSKSHLVQTWVRAKAQAEYEAMVRERKPKKPSERLKEPLMGPSSPYCKELWTILDELAEKVGGL